MAEALTVLREFDEILKVNEPLAPFTLLKIGGPAQALLQPRSREELTTVVKRCLESKIPLRILGGGGNLLISDEGVKGAVLRLSAPIFVQITVQGQRISAGAGAPLSALISQAARHGLRGLEPLVGTPDTVGGALHDSAIDPSVEMGQFVQQVEVVDATGAIAVRHKDDLRFEYRSSNLDDPVLLSVEFQLELDSADAIVKRMRKAWIQRKARQPFSFQPYARMFKNPSGLSAAGLIEQTGLIGTRVGGATVSDRDANAVIAEPGTTARDVARLMDMVKSRIQESFNVELELAVTVW